jgi:hypothetical protein
MKKIDYIYHNRYNQYIYHNRYNQYIYHNRYNQYIYHNRYNQYIYHNRYNQYIYHNICYIIIRNIEMSEILISFSRKKEKRQQGVKLPTIIERIYTKFKIDEGKCRSYLDLHLPDIIITEKLLERCVCIFKLVLRYCDGYDCNEDNDAILWYENETWSHISIKYKTKIFYKLLFADPLKILCENPNKMNAIDFEYTLESILFDDKKYAKFLNYWSKYDVLDLINVINEVSYSILNNSDGFPLEITEYILCLACDML